MTIYLPLWLNGYMLGWYAEVPGSIPGPEIHLYGLHLFMLSRVWLFTCERDTGFAFGAKSASVIYLLIYKVSCTRIWKQLYCTPSGTFDRIWIQCCLNPFSFTHFGCQYLDNTVFGLQEYNFLKLYYLPVEVY